MTIIDENISLKFLLGQPVNIHGINVYSPVLRDVVSLGYDKYNHGLSSLLFDKEIFDDFRELTESNFELVCHFFLKDSNFREAFQFGSKLVFNSEVELRIIDDFPYLMISESPITIDSFSDIQSIIKIANKIPDKKPEDEFDPGNDKARKMMEKILGDRAKRPKKKPVTNLHSIVSGLSWKSTSVNILDVGNLTVYQLYDGYHRIENIDHYNGVLTGIYTGNIDSSKIKMQENTWTKIIEF